MRKGIRPARFFFTLLAILFLSQRSVHAETVPHSRVILALFDSSEKFNREENHNFIHRFAEMPLNFLGMTLRFYDVSRGLPPETLTKDVEGILTWFDDEQMPGAAAYCRWASQQIQQGKRFVILGNIGALIDSKTKESVPLDVVNGFLNRLGLEFEGYWTYNPFVIELVSKDSSMVEFERTLDGELRTYGKVISLDQGNHVYLTLNRTDIPDGQSAVVVTTPYGGLALEGYEIFFYETEQRARWRINPFRFFEEAFGLEGRPRYDTTTLFGRRILYSHIDGDGFRNLSQQEGDSRFCGEVIRDEILKKYRLPVTVSFITAEMDPSYLGSERLLEIGRSILALDQVEIGAHGFSHPLDWKHQLVSFPLAGYATKRQDIKDATGLVAESVYPNAAQVHLDRLVYLRQETQEAVKFIDQKMAPRGKRVAINQWTGDCEPPPEALDLVAHLKIENINGGDARFDRENPSYTGLAPLARQAEGRLQVYATNANENIYTDLWGGPFDGFSHVVETFQQTETPTLVKNGPPRVAPINVYYHFYSGEKEASLRALRGVYEQALRQRVVSIFTSEYASVVRGFFNGQIARRSDGGWEFSHYGSCRTVRFDKTSQSPDLKASEGIIGFTRVNDSLYVTLAEQEKALLLLTDRPPTVPYLEEASTLLWAVQMDKRKASFFAKGFGEGTYTLRNFSPNASYRVVISSLEGQERATMLLRTDGKGTMQIRTPVSGGVLIRMSQGR